MVRGTVKAFNDEEGWGVLVSDEVPGEVWAHHSRVEDDGYRTLIVGETVEFDWLEANQEGYAYTAERIRRL